MIRAALLIPLLCIITALPCGSAIADGGVAIEDFLHVAGSCRTPWKADFMELHGDLAFIESVTSHEETSDLLIADFEDPLAPAALSTLEIPAGVDRIEFVDAFAYILSGGVLSVVDAHDPNSLTLAKSIDLPGNAFDLMLTSNFCALVQREEGIATVHFLNIDEPGNPVVVSNLPFEAAGCCIAAEGATAYIYYREPGAGYCRIQTVDVTVPADPIPLMNTRYSDSIPFEPHKAQIQGGKLVCHLKYRYGSLWNSWGWRTRVFDISVSSPVFLGKNGYISHRGDGNLKQVGAHYFTLMTHKIDTEPLNYAFSAFQVNDSESPEQVGHLNLPPAMRVSDAPSVIPFCFCVDGDDILIAVDDVLRVIDGESLVSPERIRNTNPDIRNRLWAHGERLYTYGDGNLNIYQTSPSTPYPENPVAVVNLPYVYADFHFHDNHLFAVTDAHVDVHDLTNPDHLPVINAFAIQGPPVTLRFSEEKLYVRGEEQLQIFSVEDLTDIVLSQTMPLALDQSEYNNYNRFTVNAYALCSPGADNTFCIYDTSDTSAPVATLSCDNSSWGRPLFAQHGPALYLVRIDEDNLNQVLIVYDLSDSSNPIETSRLILPSSVTDLLIKDDWLYLPSGRVKHCGGMYCFETIGSMQVFNLSDPLNPRSSWSCSAAPGTSLLVNDYHLYTEYYFVGDMVYTGSSAFPLCRDDSPITLSSMTMTPASEGTILEWQLAENSDVGSFRLTAHTADNVRRIACEEIVPGSFIARDVDPYPLDAFEITYVLECREEGNDWSELTTRTLAIDAVSAAPAIRGNFPNPFNPETTISFSLRSREQVLLTIHDIAGRLVDVVLDEAIDPGRHEVVWNGLDTFGHEQSSGLYFARLVAGGEISTQKMVLIR
ncbi:MAG: T9SS type A sorting domain-containing protein [bacterium]|nr:T9SS type A sorting domain-containing protein [bacterium]